MRNKYAKKWYVSTAILLLCLIFFLCVDVAPRPAVKQLPAQTALWQNIPRPAYLVSVQTSIQNAPEGTVSVGYARLVGEEREYAAVNQLIKNTAFAFAAQLPLPNETQNRTVTCQTMLAEPQMLSLLFTAAVTVPGGEQTARQAVTLTVNPQTGGIFRLQSFYTADRSFIAYYLTLLRGQNTEVAQQLETEGLDKLLQRFTAADDASFGSNAVYTYQTQNALGVALAVTPEDYYLVEIPFSGLSAWQVK